MTLLTVKEFAALIRVHPRTVYRRIWAHRQPGVSRHGRDIRINPQIALQEPHTASQTPGIRIPALGGLFTSV